MHSMRLGMYRTCLVVVLACTLGGYPKAAGAQDLVKEALAGFPPQTSRLEYSSPAQLRQLPNYRNLRQRFTGPSLQSLESSLSQLGIHEGDIDDLVMGWQIGDTGPALYGFASGRFDPKAMAGRAAAAGLAASPVDGQQAYCLGTDSASTCVVALGNSLGVFGSLPGLTALLEARSGKAPSLNSDDRFTRLVDSVKRDAPIWGVAVGPAVGDWFKGWMPNQGNIKLDWARVFGDVDSLVYSVRASQKANVDMLLNCSTPETAASLRQILEGLKMAQQLAWQTQNPNRPNPFEGMNVGLAGQQVSLQLTADFSQLEFVSGGGATPN
jgi:hypothetical protein